MQARLALVELSYTEKNSLASKQKQSKERGKNYDSKFLGIYPNPVYDGEIFKGDEK